MDLRFSQKSVHLVPTAQHTQTKPTEGKKMTQQEWDNATHQEKLDHTLSNNQSNDEWLADLERASKLSPRQLLRELGESL